MALIDNIVAYWKLDGNSNDSVGNKNGTDTSVSYNVSYGKINQGVDFANSAGAGTASSYITISPIPTAPGTGSFTLSFWMNPQGLAAGTSRVINWEQSGPTGEPLLDLEITTSNVVAQVNAVSLARGSAFSTNTWYFVAITRDASTRRCDLYVNGSSVANSTPGSNANLNMTSDLTFGRRFNSSYSSSQQSYDGYLDEVGYWSRCLSSTEISELYNGGAGLAYPFSSGPANLKTYNTNPKANIKTMNTNPIANVKTFDTNA